MTASCSGNCSFFGWYGRGNRWYSTTDPYTSVRQHPTQLTSMPSCRGVSRHSSPDRLHYDQSFVSCRVESLILLTGCAGPPADAPAAKELATLTLILPSLVVALLTIDILCCVCNLELTSHCSCVHMLPYNRVGIRHFILDAQTLVHDHHARFAIVSRVSQSCLHAYKFRLIASQSFLPPPSSPQACRQAERQARRWFSYSPTYHRDPGW